jgi:hypothetical protein
MPDPLVVLRRCLPLLIVVAAGCKNDGGETESDSASTAASTGGATGSSGGTGSSGTEGATEATTQPTGSASGSMSDSASSTPTSETGIMTTTVDPTTGSSAPTGAEPVPCDGPEGCTDMGEGDLAPFVLPFFRGTVCVSDKVQPGDALALAVTTCAHPCLKVTGYGYKWVYRCNGGQGIDCEVALAMFHPETTGTACPSDVFGEFDPAFCDDAGPIAVTVKPPIEGAATLLMPFLSNADVTAIDGGQNDADSVWGFIDSHAQADSRRVPVDFADGNEPAPAECGEGVPGCTCSKIGLP